MSKSKYDWPKINKRASGFVFDSIREAAEKLGIPRGTLRHAINRGDVHLTLSNPSVPEDILDKKHGFSFEESENEATLKYKAAEPLTPEEAARLSGIDLDVWKIESQRINMWQMGRKDREVDLDYEDGAATGKIKDSGEIKKTYLYQVEIKLTRKERIPVTPVLNSIEIVNGFKLKHSQVDYLTKYERVLFLTDTHFGFRSDYFSEPETFHHRRFISDLLSVAIAIKLDAIVWGGDILDLADFSKFPNEPSVVQKTQLAGIEAAWVINQFGRQTKKQIFIEGNHDIRFRKALLQNFAAAYELRPVHDLTGESMLSVPRFLGIDSNETMVWVGDYPNGFYKIGDVYFEHGALARKGSGSTETAMMKDRVHHTFFGHIHRYERASKRVGGNGDLIEVGTPGCACRLETTPGSTRFSNWNVGAFMLTLKHGKLQQVEDIVHRNGKTYFRGSTYTGSYYPTKMKEQLPSKFADAM